MKKLGAYQQELLTGEKPSLPPDMVPFWIDGQDMLTIENSIQPAPGQYVLFQKPEVLPGKGAVEVLISGKRNIFFGNASRIYRWEEGASAATNVSRVAGPPEYVLGNFDRWSFQTFGTIIFATCLAEKPQIWLPGSPTHFVNLDTLSDLGTSFRAHIFFQWGPYLLALGTDQGSTIVRWCDEDNYGIWTPQPDNTAGDLEVRDLGSDIMAATDLASGIGVYGYNQLHLISFVGTPNVFGQAHLLNGIGAFGKHAVASVGKENYGVGPKGVFRTDGTSVDYVDNPDIHGYLYSELNLNATANAICWHNPALKLVTIGVPIGNSIYPNRMASYLYDRQVWHKSGAKRTAATNATIFDFPISMDETGFVLKQSIFGNIPTSGGTPLVLLPRAAFHTLYNEGGWGGGGYGGDWTADG